MGFNGPTVAVGLFTVVLAIVLGALAGRHTGAAGGALAALASLVPAAGLAVFLELRQRKIARTKRKQEALRKFAPPKPTGGNREGQK
jgi:hypothetical protein